MSENPLDDLLRQVRACTRCTDLPEGPRPVLQVNARARILIAGQAPGRRVHASGIPFDDPSGERLRDWLGIHRDTFYDATRVALLPMGFCYPGTGPHGDLPPRPLCASSWRQPLLDQLGDIRLTLLLGQHALAWHWPDAPGSLADAVRASHQRLLAGGPPLLALPHPSPRNNRWLAQHPWFAAEVLPTLRQRVTTALGG